MRNRQKFLFVLQFVVALVLVLLVSDTADLEPNNGEKLHISQGHTHSNFQKPLLYHYKMSIWISEDIATEEYSPLQHQRESNRRENTHLVLCFDSRREREENFINCPKRGVREAGL